MLLLFSSNLGKIKQTSSAFLIFRHRIQELFHRRAWNVYLFENSVCLQSEYIPEVKDFRAILSGEEGKYIGKTKIDTEEFR